MDPSSKLAGIFKRRTLRATKPRQAVFKCLLKAEAPLTNSEIIRRATSVDRVTVYRTLALFEKIGIIHRVYVGWKYKLELTDKFIGHHHHLSCLSCGKVTDIKDEKYIENFISEVTTRFGFQPRRHQFEIEGICRKCQLKK